MKNGKPDALSESDYALLNKITLLYEQWLGVTGPEPAIYNDFGLLSDWDELNPDTEEKLRNTTLERRNNYLGSTEKIISAKK
jgi:hypothetical protein